MAAQLCTWLNHNSIFLFHYCIEWGSSGMLQLDDDEADDEGGTDWHLVMPMRSGACAALHTTLACDVDCFYTDIAFVCHCYYCCTLCIPSTQPPLLIRCPHV